MTSQLLYYILYFDLTAPMTSLYDVNYNVNAPLLRKKKKIIIIIIKNNNNNKKKKAPLHLLLNLRYHHLYYDTITLHLDVALVY